MTMTPAEVEVWVARARALFLARGASPESADRMAAACREVMARYVAVPSRGEPLPGRECGADNPPSRPRCTTSGNLQGWIGDRRPRRTRWVM